MGERRGLCRGVPGIRAGGEVNGAGEAAPFSARGGDVGVFPDDYAVTADKRLAAAILKSLARVKP